MSIAPRSRGSALLVAMVLLAALIAATIAMRASTRSLQQDRDRAS